MGALKNVIYIENSDYQTLVTTGTVTIGGTTLTYDSNNLYITPDVLASSSTDGLMSSTDKVKLDSLPTFGTAASKDFTTSVTLGSDDLVTSGAVYSAIDALPEPMIYKGTLGTGGTITTLPTASSANEGFTYKVITDGTYASQEAKVGDLFISNGSEWTLVPAGDDAGEDTVRQINVNGTELLGTAISTGYVNFKNGSNVTITGSGHDVTISATDTTYSDATTTTSGLMSASDKTKLNSIASGAEVNVQADWNVTDSSSDAFIKNKPSIPDAQVNSDWNATSGVAEILNKPNLATVATSGSYNDLSDKPTIPTVNNGTLTIQAEGVEKGTFTANQSGNTTINITKDDFIQSRTYTGLIGTSNEYKNATFYFINVKPTTWNKEWRIRYRIEAHLDDGLTPTNYALFNSIHDCEIIGARGITNAYAYFNGINNTSYRPVFYNVTHCTTETGFNAEYPHKIGVELTSSASLTDVNYKRTIKVTLLSYDGCEVTFNDTPEIPAQSTRTDYTKINATYYPNGADSNAPGYAYRGNLYSNGLQETSDADTKEIITYYSTYLTISSYLGLCGYSLFGFDSDGKIQAISKKNSSQETHSTDLSTDRVYNEGGFDWSRGLFRWSSSGYRPPDSGAIISIDKIYSSFNFKYTDNAVESGDTPLTMYGTKFVYLRGTIGDDGLFYLAPMEVTYNNQTYKKVWTQDIPTSEDGYVYWLVGSMNNSTTRTANTKLYASNPLYWFKNGEFREYNSATLPNASAAGKVLKSTNTTGGVEWGDAPATGVTSVATGAGLTGGIITSTGTIKANLVNETKSTNAATYTAGGSSKFYAVQIDKNDKLGVYVPWDANTNYYHKTGSWNGLTYTAGKVGSPEDLSFTIPIGTTAGTVCAGNDSRLSDARTPTSHTHGNIQNGGTITSTAVTSATGVLVYDSSNKIQRATAENVRTIIGAQPTVQILDLRE